MTRVCVVGGGIAGTLLAWRLASTHGLTVDLVLGLDPADATAASGGGVRCYETAPEQRGLAIDSMIELLGSQVLRGWAEYRETGSVYVGESGPDPAALADIERVLPGSVEVVAGPDLAARGWAGLPVGSVAVLERVAGHITPDRLRRAVLAELAGRSAVTLRRTVVSGLKSHADGSTTCAGVRYDIAVVAAGAWTPGLLRASGLAEREYRTKSIQYTVYPTNGAHPGMFVDETTGLYGRQTPDGALLLGVPSDRWDVTAGRPPATAALHAEAVRIAHLRFPGLRLGPARAVISAADCYTDPPVLTLRPVPDAGPRLFTFTGGSGGSVKTALAASHRAATQLAEARPTRDAQSLTFTGRRNDQ